MTAEDRLHEGMRAVEVRISAFLRRRGCAAPRFLWAPTRDGTGHHSLLVAVDQAEKGVTFPRGWVEDFSGGAVHPAALSLIDALVLVLLPTEKRVLREGDDTSAVRVGAE